jgi:polyhydroxyalkanoate synthesis regulator protein
MDAFRRNQTQFRAAMEGAFAGGPFAEIAKRNLEMFEAAASAFKAKPGAASAAPASGETNKSDDLAALKEQLADLQSRLDRLGK